MGVAGAAVSAFLLGLTPIIMMRLIDTVGWRGCYNYLGASELVGCVLVTLIWRSGSPETYGVLPDGKVSKGLGLKRKDSNLPPPIPPDSAPAAPKLTNPTFLTFVLSDLVIALNGTAFYFNLQQVVLDNPNIPNSARTYIYPGMALIGIVSRVISGFMIDKLNHRFVFLTALISSTLSLLLLPTMTIKTAFLALPLMGYSMSASGNVRSTVHAEYFGLTNLPNLQSVASSATVLGSAMGPFPYGVVHDYTGRFDGAMYVGAAVTCVAAAAVWRFGEKPGGAGGGRYEMVGREGEDYDDEEGGGAIDG
ncbi:hypothetical protein TrCOL_g5042 [Triparma columacea]|nr:hypothetical protein TrCOL_g5042 [Triparma columacea]